VLAAANALSAPLRASARVDVPALRPRPGAGAGQVLARYHGDVEEEADALAGDLARLWAEDGRRAAEGAQRRSMAVLCRKRSQIEVVEAALRARGLPVEVVGLGGLLSRPEVVDVVAALSVLHDPGRGDALMRLLTGPRWRIGARDLETLAEWAGALVPRTRTGPAAAEDRSIVDALDALPPATWVGRHGRGFSPAGHARLSGLAGVLRRLRARAALPLPELVVETERALLLDVEVAARPGIDPAAARGVLDRFTDVAAAFVEEADRPVLGAFLAWLSAAELRERGLESGEEPEDVSIAPGDVEPSRRAVQVLTVHAAKGLEWDVVAVPGLSEGTFPARRAVPRDPTAPDRGSGWLTGLGVLPYELRGDRDALPVWHWRSAATQRELDAARERFRLDCGSHEVAEERRLAYVASTRARSLLLLSGAWWADGTTPRRPSRFLLEIAQVAAGGEVPGLVTEGLDEQAVAGPRDDANPRLREPPTALWPADPLGPRRAAVTEAARLVLAADPATDAGSPWAAEVDRLLAERAAVRSGRPPVVSLPVHVSASRLVDLAADPQALAEQIRRPLPVEPRPQARLGTAFHAWLERRFRGDALVDVLDLPGAGDDDAAPDAELARLQEAFEASEWAERLPVAVEVDVETPVAGLVLRGRIDAVFRRGDGGYEVVDWKTGSRPTGERARAAAVQLAVYRLAWARLTGVPLDRVGAAFFYAATGQTVRPADGLDEAAPEALVLTVPLAPPAGGPDSLAREEGAS
jgi:DNA helicase-2/ATP-dependent DNA helicase PcrA